MVQAFHIIDNNNRSIFNEQYIIPLYQREYAWGDRQIQQLIEDIDDVNLDNDSNIDSTRDENYYIGSLIVAKKGDEFEVVDGQQRLTTLFLILSYLGIPVANQIKFSCRDRSNYTLENLKHIINNESEKYNSTHLQDNIVAGLKTVKDLLKEKDKKEKFLKKLQRVVLYRIQVPAYTDLNHYFEIMNTRGEQLEQSDVLKARLMSKLQDSNQRATFACIWDACRDMSGYVQMHFSTQLRQTLFKKEWNTFPFQEDNESLDLIQNTTQVNGRDVYTILSDEAPVNVQHEQERDGIHNRFESIIDFPYFLLHTLKVYVKHHNIQHQNPTRKLVDDLMDDKKLTDSFERVLKNGVKDGQQVQEEQFAKDFIKCLLQTRFLFDQYIIKREYVGNPDGVWSLQTLNKNQNKPVYNLTKLVNPGQWKKEEVNRKILMLQSALRVSYTSPKVMHWITNLLSWLLESALKKGIAQEISKFYDVIEKQAKEPVRKYLSEEKNEYLGVNTPHIVFNYLDFLLWRDDKTKFKDFVFEFRNSVEHWYPQNPSEGSIQQWEDEGLNSFGNLCLVHRHVNSRFSNLSPEAKRTTFPDLIEKGSLKLRLMSQLTETINSNNWREEVCRAHGDEMRKRLEKSVENT